MLSLQGVCRLGGLSYGRMLVGSGLRAGRVTLALCPLTRPFPLPPQDPHSGCPSRSSSSLSFHSTPPPLPLLQQSPATLPLALPGAPAPLPPQPQNGLGRAPGASGLGAMPMAEGLLGGLAGSGSLPLNGLLGGLNGAAAPNPAGLSQAGGAPTLQLPGCLNR